MNALTWLTRGIMIAAMPTYLLATANTYQDNWQDLQPPAVDTTAVEAVDALVEAHDCWRRTAPADMEGVFPGGAVVLRRSKPAYTENPEAIGRALDRKITVYAFCRGGEG